MWLSRADNPLVHAVGRLPATVHTKLLVYFFGTVVLLVVLGLLGFRFIGDSNERVVTLGTLQQRATAYRELQTRAGAVRQLLSLRAGGPDLCGFTNDCPGATPGAGSLLLLDGTIASTLEGLGVARDPLRLGFVPADDEQETLTLIGRDYLELADVMARMTVFDSSGGGDNGSLLLQRTDAEPLAQRLKNLTANLVSTAQGHTDALIVENSSAFADSQRLFMAVAVVSVVLALLFGYVLSWSLVGPIRRMESRLAAIAAGDFSGHVDVINRDELGALATNLNVMNDEVGRLYEALESASRHKSQFLANMSHELRTPLNAIIGFSQVLKEQMFGELNARQAEYVDDVLHSGQHLLSLINDILDLAKVEAGRMELQPTTFPLADLLENSMAMVRERAVRQSVSLDTAIDPSVGLLEGDERKVKQIIFNLLSNAVKFTPAGGRVTLAAMAIDDAVEISVRDTGVGISAEDQVRIFEEFYQAADGKTQEGTGLGLALTKRLVELHHGRLSVKSEPGAGSTFTVTLPVSQ
jgi:signal transduction histidine kinase